MTLKNKIDRTRLNQLGKGISFLALVMAIAALLPVTSGCKFYSFNQGQIPDSIRTIKINFIENKAQYVNPKLSPQLTDRLRLKILNQTRLTQTNNTSEADYEITGYISSYAVSTVGAANQQVSTNRLTVGARITLNNRRSAPVSGKNPKEINVSRNFDFDARFSLAEAENALTESIITNLVDEIFNNIFSDW